MKYKIVLIFLTIILLEIILSNYIYKKTVSYSLISDLFRLTVLFIFYFGGFALHFLLL